MSILVHVRLIGLVHNILCRVQLDIQQLRNGVHIKDQKKTNITLLACISKDKAALNYIVI